MKVGDLVRDKRFQYRHEIGVIKSIVARKGFSNIITVLWINGSFAGDTTEETLVDIRLIEQN
jgi:hypothetical protein